MSGFQTGRSMANVRQIEIIEKALAERETEWWAAVEKALASGPQTSHDLIVAVGRKNYNGV